MHETNRRAHDAFFVQIADRIGQAIIDGAYPVGGALPREADLAVKHKVGRSAIREALKMLAAKGLIESRPRRGTLVLAPRSWNMFDPDVHAWLRRTRPTPALVGELLEVRRTFEPAAAELAARRATPEAVRRIEEALARLEDATDGLADPLAADVEFHVAIVEATGNRFFAALAPLISTGLQFNLRASTAAHRAAGPAAAIAARHRPVWEAIRDRRPEAARAAVDRLLDAVGAAIEAAAPDGAAARPERDAAAAPRLAAVAAAAAAGGGRPAFG